MRDERLIENDGPILENEISHCPESLNIIIIIDLIQLPPLSIRLANLRLTVICVTHGPACMYSLPLLPSYIHYMFIGWEQWKAINAGP